MEHPAPNTREPLDELVDAALRMQRRMEHDQRSPHVLAAPRAPRDYAAGVPPPTPPPPDPHATTVMAYG